MKTLLNLPTDVLLEIGSHLQLDIVTFSMVSACLIWTSSWGIQEENIDFNAPRFAADYCLSPPSMHSGSKRLSECEQHTFFLAQFIKIF